MLSVMVPSLAPRVGSASASLEHPEHLPPCAAHGARVRGFPLGRMDAYGADDVSLLRELVDRLHQCTSTGPPSETDGSRAWAYHIGRFRRVMESEDRMDRWISDRRLPRFV